jgi:dethiobiotin synthetase
MHRYRAPSLRYWKPIQTGIEQDDDSREVRRLAALEAGEVWDEGVRLQRPVSPHLAARLTGDRIELAPLLARVNEQPASMRWIVEGAGGVLVPVNETELMIDLMAFLALPVVVVARTTLGTINHTLLTVEALRARSLTVAGVLMVGDTSDENAEAIRTHGRVSIIGQLPTLNPLTPETLARAARLLDDEGRLAQYLK